MKLRITDQFLLGLYSGLEGFGDIAHVFLEISKMQSMKYHWNTSRPIRKLSRQQFTKLVYHLKKSGYIRVKSLRGTKAVMLTKEGINRAIKASFQIENQQKVKRKDGKYIMLIFDIPKRDESKRKILRNILHNLGYKLFQKSAWITPYDAQEITEKQLQFYSLEEYVKIFLIEGTD